MTPTPQQPSAGESRRGSHSLMTILKCECRYAFRYLEMLDEATPGEPLALGSMFHLGGMHYYLARRKGGPPAGFTVLNPIDAMRMAPQRIAWTFDRAKRVWERYEPWAKRKDTWVVLDVEREYEVRLGGKLFTTRVDLTAFDPTEKAILFVDHKTSGGQLNKLYLDYEMSAQLVMQERVGVALVQAIYGVPFGGVWINTVSTRDGPQVAYRQPLRFPRIWADGVVRSMTQASIDAAELEERYCRENLTPWDLMPNPTVCRGRYGWCQFRQLCMRGDSALREYIRTGDVVTQLGEGADE